MPIRAALFDTFGTVVDWREGVARDVAHFFARQSIAGDPRLFADRWRDKYQPSMEPIRKGRRPFTRLDVLHRENLESALRDWGVDPAALEAEDLRSLNDAWQRLDPWQDSIPGLKQLRQQFIVAPLSNGNISLLTNMAKRAGLPWDCILGAEVVRAYKPQPEAYTRTAEVLGLRPDECLMVAAHNDDLAAARAAGFRTAFVCRPTEFGPGQRTDLAAESDWDFVAGNMVQLAAMST